MQPLLDFLFSNGLMALVVAVVLLICTMYLTLIERKFIGWVQIRQGPNVVGPYGILQPIADAVKVIQKEIIIPYRADSTLYVVSPYLLFALMMASWMVIPITETIVVAPMNMGLLMVIALSSFSVYSVIFASWASNSAYAVLGSIRSVAQMISYELSAGFCMLSVAMLAGSLDMHDIVISQEGLWYVVSMFPLAVVFFIVSLAETNRVPFDVVEGESEIVGGYSVEYTGLLFSFFFFGEYLGLLLMSALFTVLFLGGWLSPIAGIELPLLMFTIKVSIVVFLFLWVRATLPRMRYDQIMMLGWKVLLPFSMLWFYGATFVAVWRAS